MKHPHSTRCHYVIFARRRGNRYLHRSLETPRGITSAGDSPVTG